MVDIRVIIDFVHLPTFPSDHLRLRFHHLALAFDSTASDATITARHSPSSLLISHSHHPTSCV